MIDSTINNLEFVPKSNPVLAVHRVLACSPSSKIAYPESSIANSDLTT